MTSNTPLLVHRRARTRRIRSSIRPLVEFLDSKWLEFCAERKALRLSKCSVVPHPAETLADHEYYKFFPHVRYYSIVPQPPKSGVELSEELRKAALTRCTCEDVVIACWNYLWKELGKIPGFVKIESKRANVLPRLVLFDHTTLPCKDTVYGHNYIIITFRRGFRFVLDLTGYQFGFRKVLYTLGEYEHEVLQGRGNGSLVNVREEIWDNTDLARGISIYVDEKGEDEPVSHGVRSDALALLDFAFRLGGGH